MSVSPRNVELCTRESGCIDRLKFWLRIEASILKQKSRVKWLKEVDQNYGYFHAYLKARSSNNRIDSLVTDASVTLLNQAATEQEILDFYKKLLGEAKKDLRAVDAMAIRRGNCLKEEQTQALVADI